MGTGRWEQLEMLNSCDMPRARRNTDFWCGSDTVATTWVPGLADTQVTPGRICHSAFEILT